MNIEKNSVAIKNIFQAGYNTPSSLSFDAIKNNYKKINSPHSIVFFEGLSVRYAIDSFQKKNDLSLWIDYNRFFSLNFAKQNYIGLGWAMGELGVDPSDYLTEIAHEWKSKVWNGYGYYTGTIKRRSILRTNTFPEAIPKEYIDEFIYGFGRSLWYTYKGDLEKISKIISTFNSEQQIHLWKGLGVAIAFVGGLSKDDWVEIKNNSAENQLKKGFILAYSSLKDEETTFFLGKFFEINK